VRPLRLSEVAEVVGGRRVGDDVEVSSISVDSRSAAPGALFFAIRGERGDGHDFVADAFSRGCAAAVVHDPDPARGPAVVAGDTREALLALARHERANSDALLIGITGSTGKTSTKDMTASVLGSRFHVHASPSSYNNEIGLPLTILGAPPETELIVAEMGSRGMGHIASLADVARPQVGIVTNVGLAHLELFGSKEAIAGAKAELVQALPGDGLAILPADDPVASGFAALTRARTITFGTSPGADVVAEQMVLDDEGCASFFLAAAGGRERVELVVPGEHMVPNALAAAACGLHLGLSPAECAAALKGARVSSWRMETFVNAVGVRVVNDAYNANPDSMAAALRTARWMARSGRLIAVLGRMAELGPATAAEHDRVGELAARLRVDRVVTVGEQARAIADAAVREGVEPENVASYTDPEEALADVNEWARAGDVVLFKASRVVGLERLAEAMR